MRASPQSLVLCRPSDAATESSDHNEYESQSASSSSQQQSQPPPPPSQSNPHRRSRPPLDVAHAGPNYLPFARLGPTLLPPHIASLITALALSAKISLRTSALFIEAILESAKYSTSVGLGLTRRALISAVGAARSMYYVKGGLEWDGSDKGQPTSDAFLRILDRYTNLGIYMVHHTFTLAELFVQAGLSLTSTSISTSLSTAEESVRILDGIFGSNETSRALSAIISLLSSEIAPPQGTGRLGWAKALTKALVAFACLQRATYRRTVEDQGLSVVWDCVVMAEEVREKVRQCRLSLTPSEDAFLLSDVRSALEQRHDDRDVSGAGSRPLSTRTIRPRSGSDAGSSRPETPTLSGDGEPDSERELIHDLTELIGPSDCSSEGSSSDELPEQIRRIIEAGDETVDETHTVWQITTETTETTTVREETYSRPRLDRSRTRSANGLLQSTPSPSTPVAPTSPAQSTAALTSAQEDEWIELPPDDFPPPRRQNRLSIASQSYADTLRDPEEGRARLQTVVRTVTKHLTQKRLVRKAESTTSSLRGTRASRRQNDVRVIVWEEESDNASSSAQRGSPLLGRSSPKAKGKWKAKGRVGRSVSPPSRKSASLRGVMDRVGRSFSAKSSPKRSHSQDPSAMPTIEVDSPSASPSSSRTFSPPTRPPPTPSPAPPLLSPIPTSSSLIPFPSVETPRRSPDVLPSPQIESPPSAPSTPTPQYGRLRPIRQEHRTNQPSITSLHSIVTQSVTAAGPTADTGEAGGAGIGGNIFPRDHFVRNVHRFMRYASAAYGQSFMRILGIGSADFNFPSTKHHANHHAFAYHNNIPIDAILLSSFTEPSGSFHSTKLSPLVHYVAVDPLGLSDVLVDLACKYEEIQVEGGDPEAYYAVHQGMLVSALQLKSSSSTVHETVRIALEKNKDYGLVLCGHSLGGGVAAILSILWGCPINVFREQNVAQPSPVNVFDPTPFVTGFSSGFPPGRPIACYTYGVPCVTSPDLSYYARGLITSVVHNNDIVPTLSLGLLHDLRKVAISLEEEGNVAEEIFGRVIGIHPRRLVSRASASLTFGGRSGRSGGGEGREAEEDEDNEQLMLFHVDELEIVTGHTANRAVVPGYKDPALARAYAEEAKMDSELNDWLWSLRKTMRADMDNLKLIPPGEVFIIEHFDCFISTLPKSQTTTTATAAGGGGETTAKISSSKHQAHRIILRYCEAPEKRFSEPLFAKSMFTDHNPKQYESCTQLLYDGCISDMDANGL